MITRKRISVEPELRNDEVHIQERRQYATRAIQWLDDSIVYVDEAGFTRSLEVSYGYSGVGDPAIVTGSAARGPRLNVIGAMTFTEMLYFECSFESTNGDRYADFISHMINSRPDLFGSKHFRIVHDGVSFHHSPQVLEVLENQPMQHFFEVIPGYSPALNAIENAWKAVRDIAKRRIKELLEQRISLQQLITESIRQVSSEQCQGFHRGVKHALASCFEGRPLAMNSSSIEYSVDDQPLQYVDEQDQSSPNEDATESEEQAQE